MHGPAKGRKAQSSQSPLSFINAAGTRKVDPDGRPADALSSAFMQVMLNGSPHRFDPPPATVAELVRALNLEGKRIAVEMNGEIVPKSRYGQTRVASGDQLEVVAAVGGG
jgi:sulfur carrier protein